MAADADGVSGSTNMRRADHYLPLPSPLACISEPAAASRVSPGTSPARSKATGGAACNDYHAEPEPEPELEPEESAGRSTQMLLAMAAMGGRGGHYGHRPASSYGSCAAWSDGSLTDHRPPSPNPTFSGGDDREPHGGDGTSSFFVTPRLEEEPRRLPEIADFTVPSSTPQNTRLQTSLLDRRARLSAELAPVVSEVDEEVHNQDQPIETVFSPISSALVSKIESDGAFEDSNGTTAFMKPSAAPLSITLLKPSRPSLLGCIFTAGHLKQASAGSSTSTRASSGSGKDQTSSATGKPKEDHTSTLGGRGGYGDPHPPPFYKCEICRRRTAFYRIKCCRVVVCDFCGCYCDPEETDDEKVQVQVAEKEKLPEVKTDGEDLFLWQPFSFPADLMLCMAKREGPKLRYYFASIEDLLNPMIRSIRARVYCFVQQGINARSLSVTGISFSRSAELANSN